MGTFRDLVVWRRAFELCISVYRATEGFPINERYGLSAELRKTARSVLYNIAEGHRRSSQREFVRFLDISQGSGAELETQILLSRALAYLPPHDANQLLAKLDAVARMLMRLKGHLRSQQATHAVPNSTLKTQEP